MINITHHRALLVCFEGVNRCYRAKGITPTVRVLVIEVITTYLDLLYIGDKARKLFKILSTRLGEEVNKYNFCWAVERSIEARRATTGQFQGIEKYFSESA